MTEIMRKTASIRKYLEVAKVLFKAQLMYRFDVAFTMVFAVTKVIFAYVLWGAIFGERETVAGFSFQAMLSYYIISAFLAQLDMSDGTSGEISSRIRNGTFSKYMVVPISPFGYFCAQTAGAAGFYGIFNLIASFAWVFLFRVEFTFSLSSFPAAIIICALGLFFMMQLNFFLGILAFKWGDIWIFLMLKNGLVSFVTGAFVPLAILPEAVISVMRYLPFYYVTYLPSMLMIGRNEGEALIGAITLLLWISALVPLNRMMYKRLRIKYDGVGI